MLRQKNMLLEFKDIPPEKNSQKIKSKKKKQKKLLGCFYLPGFFQPSPFV